MELSELLRYLPRITIRFKGSSQSRIQGYHSGKSKGFDEDRNDYRLYTPGDDLRYLDWRLLARTDKLYLREGLKHEKQNVILWLDTSASMRHPPQRYENGLLATLGLASILLKQHDRVSLHSDHLDQPLVNLKKMPDIFAAEKLLRQPLRAHQSKNSRALSNPEEWYPLNGNFRVLLVTDLYMSAGNALAISSVLAKLRAGLSVLHLTHTSDTENSSAGKFFSGYLDAESGAFMGTERIADKSRIFEDAIQIRRQCFSRYGFPVFSADVDSGPLHIIHSLKNL